MNKLFIVAGLILLIIGLLLTYAPNALHWFGRLPGDVRIENEKGGFYFPIVSMIIISIVLSLLSYIFGRR